MRGIKAVSTDGEEISFPTMTKAAEYFGVSMPTLRYRINTKGEYDGYKVFRSEYVKDKTEEGKKIQKYKAKIVPYELKNKLICITPCPYRELIKVGSALCQQCSSYHGKNKYKQGVYCTHKV